MSIYSIIIQIYNMVTGLFNSSDNILKIEVKVLITLLSNFIRQARKPKCQMKLLKQSVRIMRYATSFYVTCTSKSNVRKCKSILFYASLTSFRHAYSLKYGVLRI